MFCQIETQTNRASIEYTRELALIQVPQYILHVLTLACRLPDKGRNLLTNQESKHETYLAQMSGKCTMHY